MSVGRICQREVDLARSDETVREAAERMHQRTVGTLVVLGALKQPVGILTDRDLVIRVLAAGRDPGETRVGDVMTPHPTSVEEETPIETALALMKSGAFRRLPVVDRGGRLVGLVSLDDILLLLSEEFVSIGGLLARETPRSVAE
jgi:CBS domain-containing protein